MLRFLLEIIATVLRKQEDQMNDKLLPNQASESWNYTKPEEEDRMKGRKTNKEKRRENLT